MIFPADVLNRKLTQQLRYRYPNQSEGYNPERSVSYGEYARKYGKKNRRISRLPPPLLPPPPRPALPASPSPPPRPVIGPSSNTDIADQVQMLNNAVNSKPDGIGIAASDKEADPDRCIRRRNGIFQRRIHVFGRNAAQPTAPLSDCLTAVQTVLYSTPQCPRGRSQGPYPVPDRRRFPVALMPRIKMQ